MSIEKTKNEVTLADGTVLHIGDKCTTAWHGNGEMEVIAFYWTYDHPIKVIRLCDSAIFFLQRSDLIAYN